VDFLGISPSEVGALPPGNRADADDSCDLLGLLAEPVTRPSSPKMVATYETKVNMETVDEAQPACLLGAFAP